MKHQTAPNGGNRAACGDQVWPANEKKGRQDRPCIWMQAGAVAQKHCGNFYQCNTCKYDRGLQKRVADGKQISWQEALRRRESAHRTCRHALTGRTGNRICAHNYNCGSCEFDQYLEDVLVPATGGSAPTATDVHGFAVPQGYYFHNGHAWARIESGGLIRIGLDDFALKLLGKADGLELPLTGQELERDKPGWGLSRRGNAAAVLSPVNGIIMSVNPGVNKDPGRANRDPYGDGWLFTVHTRDIDGEMKNLMNDEQSLPWISREADTLIGMIETVNGPLAADGGILVDDIFGRVPSLGWRILTATFLKT